MFKGMRWIALSLVCAAVTGVAATASPARTAMLSVTTGPTPPIRSALFDPIFRTSQQTTAFAMASRAGATYARIGVLWTSVAPLTLPSKGFHPADPASPYYRWSRLDATVAAALANNVQPIFDIWGPPDWAYEVQPGSWTGGSPKLEALGDFATALASHYRDSVHAFSVWNEPNFTRNLYPQDPTYYRSMVNAVADSVHAVNPANLALAGELAPYKHAASPTDKNTPIPPLDFMRTMLCISNTTPAQRTCNTPAKFDVWTHHPYSDTGPFGQATASGGVELGDLPKMKSLLQTAQNLGAISSAKPVQLWVTEIGWSSNPPNTKGVPIGLETRWVAETYYQMWKSGVTLGTWFLLQDLPRSTPYQSGLYFNSADVSRAVAKPMLMPFRFPFVAYLRAGGNVQIWGRDATSDLRAVAIQQRIGTGGAWQTVATITSNSYGIFRATLSLGAKSTYFLRAVAPGSGNSAAFSLTVPPNENLNVTPFPLGG